MRRARGLAVRWAAGLLAASVCCAGPSCSRTGTQKSPTNPAAPDRAPGTAARPQTASDSAHPRPPDTPTPPDDRTQTAHAAPDRSPTDTPTTTSSDTLEIWPPRLALVGPGDGMQLVVTRRRPDGTAEDVTRACKFHIDGPGSVRVSDTGYLEVSAGDEGHAGRATPAKCAVRADADGLTAHAEFSIGQAELPVSDFALDIVPLLTKAGCASGACHGSAQGRGGLRLSLFGYDPAADYAAITREHEGRRVDGIESEQSLILRKPALQMPHGGGKRFGRGQAEFARLLRWLRAGAPFQDPSRARLERIVVTPSEQFLARAPASQQLSVLAEYADGSRRDVTRLCLFTSNDAETAEVDARGLVQMKGRGQADLVVRFAHLPATVRLSAPLNDRVAFDFDSVPTRNVIDRRVLERLKRLKVPASPRSNDAEFLRRVYFDLVGMLPTTSDTESFLADTDPQKRDKLIERLLTGEDAATGTRLIRSEFAAFWSVKFGDLLGITSGSMGTAAGAYKLWLRKQLDLMPRGAGAGYDQIVRRLLLAEGKLVGESGPVAYYAAPRAPDEIAEQAARRFLGVRIRCARCHDHPLDVWTQDDYYGFAAFFGHVRVETDETNQLAQVVRFDKENVVRHVRTGERPPYKPLGAPPRTIDPDTDPRKALVEWLLGSDNPYFARMAANWVWAHLMGRGLVEPIDDLRMTNPATHPDLLDELAGQFRESGYDLRALIRLIVQSETYQRTSVPRPDNAADDRLYSRYYPRPLGAYELADAIAAVTSIPNVFPGSRSPRDRAVDLNDPTVRSELLDNLGRCDRLSGCEVGRRSQSASLRAALQLIVGNPINEKLNQTKSLSYQLAKAMQEADSPDPAGLRDAQIRSLYLRAYCREPRGDERLFWAKYMSEAENLPEAYADMLWAMLNSSEFVFNH